MLRSFPTTLKQMQSAMPFENPVNKSSNMLFWPPFERINAIQKASRVGPVHENGFPFKSEITSPLYQETSELSFYASYNAVYGCKAQRDSTALHKESNGTFASLRPTLGGFLQGSGRAIFGHLELQNLSLQRKGGPLRMCQDDFELQTVDSTSVPVQSFPQHDIGFGENYGKCFLFTEALCMNWISLSAPNVTLFALTNDWLSKFMSA